MHVAIVTETYPPEVNGVALTVRNMEFGLRSAGLRTSIVRPRQPSDVDGELSDGQTLVRGASLPRYPGLQFGWPAGRRLRRLWTTHRPDVAYVATEGPLGWSALRTANALRIPVVAGFHTRFDEYMKRYGFPFLAPVAWRWMRSFHNRAQRTLVPTEALRKLLTAGGFRHVSVLGRAVDGERFHPSRRDEALRARWGLGNQQLAVCHVGRIAPEKNLDLLISAFDAIEAEHPAARMVWIGDGPSCADLQRLYPGHVFCGVLRGTALAAHLASTDLFLFPSVTETFGNVTLEAMASGVATVAFDYGAAGTCMRHDESGVLVPLSEPARFVAESARLARDAALRGRISTTARQVIESLRPDVITRQLIDILKEVRHGQDAEYALASR